MAGAPQDLRIFISAAEPSADLHGASLIQAVTALKPGARFRGVAGPKMQQAGCHAIYDMSRHSSMLMGAFGNVHHGYQMLTLCRRELQRQPFDAAVLIDSPILNLRVARRAKAQGIPVLYYIAPQLWAWGGRFRIRAVRAGVDRVACLLPFEEPFFRSYGLDASYVGHPLFAELARRAPDIAAVQRLKNGGGPVLALMPGSRKHVVAENLPGQLQAARRIRSRFGDLKVLISVANAQVRPLLAELSQAVTFPVQFHEGFNAELLRAADLALVVSGTVTLEAAFHGTPMIVMYNSSRWVYQFIRLIIDTKYFSLPNILAGREVVPEFMPYYRSPEPIAERAIDLLDDEQARQQQRRALAEVVRPFLDTAAAQTTAKLVLDLVEQSSQKAQSKG